MFQVTFISLCQIKNYHAIPYHTKSAMKNLKVAYNNGLRRLLGLPSPLRFNSTSSSIKKLKASYNGVLRRLLLIVKPYSASEMLVTHCIPSFF